MPFSLDEFEARSPAISARQWRDRLTRGESLIGLWNVSASPINAEILGMSGADWIILDAEHSANDIAVLVPQLQTLAALPVFTVVRAPSKDPLILGRLLDIGARGLMVPMIETAEEASAVVEATRYSPRGRRGVGGGFARAARWNGISDYLSTAEQSFSLIAQIETEKSVANLADILDVDGIDAVFFGPADLAASLGLLGQARHQHVRELILNGIETVVSSGRIAGVNAFSHEDARLYQSAGARLLAVGADVTILTSGSVGIVDSFAAPAPAPVSASKGH
ncbi:MAG: hpaI [Subtercola sp.]|nr:hpaI [Subtercola sp.]